MNLKGAPVPELTLKEFIDAGFLQEVNRQFFHPLGLALSVVIHDDGSMEFGPVWDYRDDPEGLVFSEHVLDANKAARVAALRASKLAHRQALFNSPTPVQPVR